MRQTFFSLTQSPTLLIPLYRRDLLIGGRYLHRRVVLYAIIKKDQR